MTKRRRLAMLVLGITLSIGNFAFAATAHAVPQPGQPVSPAAVGALRQNGFYQIINQNSNKCLTSLTNSADDANAIIGQRICENGPRYRWRVDPATNGHYVLALQSSRHCMDLQGRNLGTPIRQSEGLCDSGHDTQRWLLVPSNIFPYYRIQNLFSGLCADVRNRSTANDAVLQGIECKINESAQRFRFVR
jgi:Ricin-type beta-trefoil lectin domain-like